MSTSIDLILGAVFMVFGAADRFNTPATNRSSTTAGRYFVALFCYCMVGLAAYALLVHFPNLVTVLFQMENAAPEPWAQQLSNPLLVALLLTVLLPKLPMLNDVDHWIRRRLQDMAAIPFEVRRLAAELRKLTPEASAEFQAEVRQRLERNGFHGADLRFEAELNPRSQWTRLAALLIRLDDWESDKRMAGFLAAFPGRLAELHKQYEQLEPKAKNCFRLLAETSTSTSSVGTQDAVARYCEDFLEQSAELYRSVLDFVSRGILHAEFTDGARIHRLRELGYVLEAPGVGFNFNQLMLVFSQVFLIMLVGMAMFSGPATGMTFGRTLARIVMIAAVYCVAVVCAVLPRGKWNFAHHRPGEVRPFAFYLLAGLMAAIFGQALNLVFGCLQDLSFAQGWQRFLLTYPWLLASFATALLTALLTDNARHPRLSRPQQRSLEGLIQGLAMSGVGYVVHEWLVDRLAQVTATAPLAIKYCVPELGPVMVIAGIIGFMIGFCIPTWCREAAPARLAAAPAALPVAGLARI